MQNKLILGGVVLILVVGGFWFTSKQSSAPSDTPTPTESVMASASPDTSASPTAKNSHMPSPTPLVSAGIGVTVRPLKVFEVSASNFKFSLSEIKVKKGDKVQIVFKNDAGMHDWKIDEFNAGTKQLKAGETETVTFNVDKTGSFEYYCSVGSHRAMGMKGNLIVE